MKAGDEGMINGQAEMLANIDANIKSMTNSKQKLHIFAQKIKIARMNQNVGEGMVAVSQALGRVTKNMPLEKARRNLTALCAISHTDAVFLG